MRTILLVIACGACGGSSPAPASDDAASSFTFTADYVLDSTITSASVGSASYSGGETIHISLEFTSYAASQGSGLPVLVVAGTETGAFAITPSCPVGCTDASDERLDAEVSWQGGVIVTDLSGDCDSRSNVCGWAE
ncbi:MAG TPA: hypothetical protein VH143_25265 [Kofleriaceae bacterium]|nr:hypothetical protein [Kofleriaceae bacterium]